MITINQDYNIQYGFNRYKIINPKQEFDFCDFIFVEIPHQMPAKASGFTKQEFINFAHNKTAMTDKSFSKIYADEIKYIYDDENPISDYAKKLIEKQGFYYEVDGVIEESYSEFEWACEVLTYDLNNGQFLYNLDQAIDFIEHHAGHQAIKAQYKVIEVLLFNNVIEQIKDL